MLILGEDIGWRVGGGGGGVGWGDDGVQHYGVVSIYPLTMLQSP